MHDAKVMAAQRDHVAKAIACPCDHEASMLLSNKPQPPPSLSLPLSLSIQA